MKQYQNVKFIDFYVERIKEGRFYYDPVFSRVQGKTLPDPDQGKTLPDPQPCSQQIEKLGRVFQTRDWS